METLLTHCAALDVHKASVQVCCITPDTDGKPTIQQHKTSTFTADLLALRDWLKQAQVTHVALESTGSYWRPIYNILEGHFELLLVNPNHVKNVPGRKTDVKDARWLVQLLQHGLLRASFVPPASQRALRDLTRTRTRIMSVKLWVEEIPILGGINQHGRVDQRGLTNRRRSGGGRSDSCRCAGGVGASTR